MPSELLRAHDQQQLFEKVIELLQLPDNGENETSQEEEESETGDDLEFGLLGSKVKLDKKVKKLLRYQDKLTEQGAAEQVFSKPLVVTLGSTTQYATRELTSLLSDNKIPHQLLHLQLKPGSATAGMVVEATINGRSEVLPLAADHANLESGLFLLLESGKLASLLTEYDLQSVVVVGLNWLDPDKVLSFPVINCNLLRKTINVW